MQRKIYSFHIRKILLKVLKSPFRCWQCELELSHSLNDFHSLKMQILMCLINALSHRSKSPLSRKNPKRINVFLLFFSPNFRILNSKALGIITSILLPVNISCSALWLLLSTLIIFIEKSFSFSLVRSITQRTRLN